MELAKQRKDCRGYMEQRRVVLEERWVSMVGDS